MIRTSFVLCTYNGQAYVSALLHSALAQETQIDEFIVADDGSSDQTVDAVMDAMRTAEARLRLVRNERRLGATANFSCALRLAQGDVVFLADQDDVWLPSKVTRVVAAFEAHSEALAVFHDARLIDAVNAPLQKTLSQALRCPPSARGAELFTRLLGRNLVAGCTLAVRRPLLVCALPTPPLFMHDEWLALCAAASGRLHRVADPLIDYRLHPGNHLGLRGIGWSASVRAAPHAGALRRDRLQRLLTLRDWIDLDSSRFSVENRQRLSDAIAHWTVRAALPRSALARARCVSREWISGRYNRYASGWMSALRDVVKPHY